MADDAVSIILKHTLIWISQCVLFSNTSDWFFLILSYKYHFRFSGIDLNFVINWVELFAYENWRFSRLTTKFFKNELYQNVHLVQGVPQMSHTFTSKIFVELPKCPNFWDIWGIETGWSETSDKNRLLPLPYFLTR